MVAKLIVTLEQGMQKGLLHNQSSGVAAFAKQIINLAGLAADSTYKLRGRRSIEFDYAPCKIRTCGPLLRRQLLYPAELREQSCF